MCLSWFKFPAETDEIRAGVARGLVRAPALPSAAVTADDATGLSANGGYHSIALTLLHVPSMWSFDTYSLQQYT
jgi:hypothetical protein